MKYLVALLFGTALGVAVAGALLYFNPLIVASGKLDASAPMRYSLSGPRMLASAHNRLPGAPVVPADSPALWERGVRGSWLQAFVVEDANGQPAGVATKFIVPSADSNGIHNGLVTDDHWLITVPGRGTLTAASKSTAWPLVGDSLVRVNLLDRPWDGDGAYALQHAGAAEIIGTSGELAGIAGALDENIVLRDYPHRGFDGLQGRLRIDLGLTP